jgi:MurNAc alpha-1-phosphate uridylyltransferase
MKAMILAAGFGKRLGEITSKIPKILVDINGKTLLQLLLEKFRREGFDNIIINVHHFADMVEEQAEKLASQLRISVTISDERDELLDTGGGVYKARHFLGDEPFLLYNGDILTDINLKKLFDFHIRKQAAATIATRQRPGNRVFLVDKDGRIRGWTNRESGMDIVTIEQPMELNEIASMAISVFDPKVFELMNEGKYSMTPIILELARQDPVITFRHDTGYWIDIGSPEKLNEARELLK